MGMKSCVVVFAAAALGLGACAKQPGAPASSAANAEAQAFSKAIADAFVAQQTGVAADKVAQQSKATLLRKFARLKAAADAEEGIVNPATRTAIELQRIELLAHAGATRAGVYATPSDTELRTQYNRFVAGLPAREFHVAHILVATEGMAQVLITELQAGADFSKLAREKSADDSNVKGGDIGWISTGKLPADFTAAAQALKPGQFTPHPVHTIYGWHVIKVLEARSAAAPPYEQVKAQLIDDIQQQRYESFLAGVEARTANR